jgi:uncharacterized protein
VKVVERLLVDAMLGSLARWLRTLGYDTVYDASLSDDELVRRARAEGRVLLTRDRALARRRNLQSLLIESQNLNAQMRQALTGLPLPRPRPYSRCLICNEPLEPMLRSEAWGLTPPYVFVRYDQFHLCPTCNRVYWRGTHWGNMNTTIDAFVAVWEGAQEGALREGMD